TSTGPTGSPAGTARSRSEPSGPPRPPRPAGSVEPSPRAVAARAARQPVPRRLLRRAARDAVLVEPAGATRVRPHAHQLPAPPDRRVLPPDPLAERATEPRGDDRHAAPRLSARLRLYAPRA